MCATPDGAELVTILDILHVEPHLYLIVKGKREQPYVFEIMYNGFRVANREGTEKALAVHRAELEKVMGNASGG